eukprot:scaffold2404_cov398-Prasinococcus_capsulatus_cf.AAC.43
MAVIDSGTITRLQHHFRSADLIPNSLYHFRDNCVGHNVLVVSRHFAHVFKGGVVREYRFDCLLQDTPHCPHCSGQVVCSAPYSCTPEETCPPHACDAVPQARSCQVKE